MMNISGRSTVLKQQAVISGSQGNAFRNAFNRQYSKQQAVLVVGIVTGSNRHAWRVHYNLVGAQERTQVHETRSGRVRRQNVVTLGKN